MTPLSLRLDDESYLNAVELEEISLKITGVYSSLRQKVVELIDSRDSRIIQLWFEAVHDECNERDGWSVMRAFIKLGLPVDVKGQDEWTGLHSAANHGNHDVMNFLLEAGADKELLTPEGDSVMDLCCSDSECVEVLKNF